MSKNHKKHTCKKMLNFTYVEHVFGICETRVQLNTAFYTCTTFVQYAYFVCLCICKIRV